MVISSPTVDLVKSHTRRAVGLVLLCGILNSFGGLILRHIDGSSEWQIVFFRSAALSLGLFFFFLARNGPRLAHNLRMVGVWGLVCGAFFGTMQTMFVLSLSNTTVANTAFILSSGPILTAFLARLVLGERVGPATWVVLLAAVTGISLMVGDGLVTGSILGDLAAVAGAFSFACFVVILRARRTVDMVPSVITGGLMATVFAFLATGMDLAVPAHDAGLAVFWGGGLSALVLLLFTFASRHLTGAVLTVLLMVEYFLGPFWVWVFLDETPSALALIGGAIVLTAVAAQAYLSALEPQRKRAG